MSAAAAHKTEHEEPAHDEHGHDAHGHAEAGHAEPAAANNSDFIAEGGVVPLVRDIGKLLLGVTIQAPIDAARGGATADPKHAKHPPEGKHDKAHDKAHPKKEADAAGAAPGGHAGHSAEATSDYLAAAQSIGKVLEEFLDGKVDKHSVEHAVDHWLDARNFGLARPFAGTIAKASVWGLSKVRKLRDHALEKLEPQWETLGRQILTGLPHDEKHGYHAGVENLCHTMNKVDLKDNFSKFLGDDAIFEDSLKTEKGREVVQQQIARILGRKDKPHPNEVKKRIHDIEHILSLHHEHHGLWHKLKSFVGFGGKKEEAHNKDHEHKEEAHKEDHGIWHKLKSFAGFGGKKEEVEKKKAAEKKEEEEHTLDDKDAEANRQILLGILHKMNEYCTKPDKLAAIYEGKKEAIDYDKFGDQADEMTVKGDEGVLTFMNSFSGSSFKNKFKGLIEPARLKALVASEKGRAELHTLMVALWDIEPTGELDENGLNEEIIELMGEEGLGVEKLKPESKVGKLKNSAFYKDQPKAEKNYAVLLQYIRTIKANLTAKVGGRTVIDLIYKAKTEVIDYEKFGRDMTKKTIDGGLARLNFMNSFKPAFFDSQYRRLLDGGRMQNDLRSATSRASLRKLLAGLLDLDEDETLNEARLNAEYKQIFGPKGVLGEEAMYDEGSDARKNFNALQSSIDSIMGNLKKKMPDPDERLVLDVLYEDEFTVKFEQFGQQLNNLEPEKVRAYLRTYTPGRFILQFRSLLNKESLSKLVLNEDTRRAALAQLFNFLGLPPGPVDEVYMTTTKAYWKSMMNKGNQAPLDAQYKAWEENVDTVFGVLSDAELFKTLLEGKKMSIYDNFAMAVTNDYMVVVKLYDELTFLRHFSMITQGGNIGKLSKEDKNKMRDEIEKFFGGKVDRVSTVSQLIEAMDKKLSANEQSKGVREQLAKVKATLTTGANLEEIYKD